MSFEFHLPDIGEGVIEGEVVAWKVQEGDSVDLDQPMVEIMTDKATVEIPSPRAGRISKIRFQEGEICPVGDVLVVIETAGGVAEVAAAVTTGAEVAPASPPSPVFVDASPGRARILATPATRRLARELGVELSSVVGTGRNGRVTSDDVRSVAAVTPSSSAPVGQAGAEAPRRHRTPTIAVAPPPAAMVRSQSPQALAATTSRAPKPSSSDSGREERVPFRGMRKRIAENMALSKFTATHFTYVEEIDMTELVELRTRAKLRAEERGLKLTYLPFIIKAIVAGLKKWPQLNASLDVAAQEIVRKHYYHIGIAAQGPQGLMVSVIRDADRRSIFEIAAEIARLGKSVADGTAKREELTGSTFTITSLGKLGGVMATPIINYPEVGILGVHKIAERPAVVDGQIAIRSLMNLSISLDHRLVDGWDGAMFLQGVKSLLEDPTLMFMELS